MELIIKQLKREVGKFNKRQCLFNGIKCGYEMDKYFLNFSIKRLNMNIRINVNLLNLIFELMVIIIQFECYYKNVILLMNVWIDDMDTLSYLLHKRVHM